jgi:hypothetical protein
MVDAIQSLEKWFAENCNGEWEHGIGVKIETLDNPGWGVKIDLSGTPHEMKTFAPVEIERTERDWLYCNVEASVFIAAGGAFNLAEIIEIFLVWTREN